MFVKMLLEIKKGTALLLIYIFLYLPQNKRRFILELFILSNKIITEIKLMWWLFTFVRSTMLQSAAVLANVLHF